jgi:hypothetical protein
MKYKILPLVIYIILITSFQIFSNANPYGEGNFSESAYSSSVTEEENDSECENDSPDDVRISALITTENKIQIIFWKVSEPVKNYEIKWGENENLAENYIDDVKIPDSKDNYTIENLITNTTYYIKMRSVNGCAAGDWTDTLSAKTAGQETQPTTNPVEIVENTATENVVSKEVEKPSGTSNFIADIKVKFVNKRQKSLESVRAKIENSDSDWLISDSSGIVELGKINSTNFVVLADFEENVTKHTINIVGTGEKVYELTVELESKQNFNWVLIPGVFLAVVTLFFIKKKLR